MKNLSLLALTILVVMGLISCESSNKTPGIEKAIQSMQNSICQKITSDVAKALSNPDLDYRREHLTSALQTLFQKKEK